MATPPLSLVELQKAQAEVEGFQQGPAPALNAANLNTQDNLGNPQTPSTSPAPYYPSAETPNLQLSTEDMSAQLANNFVILDAAISSVPVVQASLQAINTTVNHSVSLLAPTTNMYTVSLYMSSPGGAGAGYEVVITISYTCELGPETISIVLPLDSSQIIMETYPVLAIGGTTITLSTAYEGGAVNNPYNISARIVEF